ncbi:hypothetical protein A5664_11335 [Mycolicibacterium fortuitum]|nr:hypothetical protein [Mycolicibacterium fortuitum]OBB29956.1 hypothetical protein A5763_14735 [Mycolicibacterium fortuitum]OBI68377.1 hypothetical protein A5664_11335 [Mycolicibacterium fortuitum]OBJ98164.1 hypothetical protein A5638_11865 [Mycolicibacterium fortuitum]WAY22507.1 hypothetical protein OF855_14410 [Mycolicibacterium fortuitum]
MENVRFHIVAAIAVGVTVFSPLPPAQAWPWPPPPGIEDINGYPIAEGDYSSPTDHYGLFFRTPDGRHCGIRPNRGPVGCDAVPADAPEGMNQTFVEAGAPATYRYSGTPSFTRDDVDVLPAGYRLENWEAACALTQEGAVICKTSGRHGFSLDTASGTLW